MIPLIDLQQQFVFLKKRILSEMSRVIDGGKFIMGPKVEELERRMKDRLGVPHVVTVANGTDALVIALEAHGVGKGDEVITTPFTFFATAEAIARVGAMPVFADIDPQTYNIDPAKIEEKITQRSKAIIPVHLFGQPADMDEITTIAHHHQLLVIEDACQAFGAEYRGKPAGSLGDVACFSFFPTKNLGTLGDGGMIAFKNPDAAEKARLLRQHGSKSKYFHSLIGYNSRLDEIHAAILIIMLDEIDKWNEKRREVASHYRETLQNLPGIHVPMERTDRKHIYHLFCLETDSHELRDHIKASLEQKDIQCGVYYPLPLHQQQVFADLPYQEGQFPKAEKAAYHLLAIPMGPFLNEGDQDAVISTIGEAIKQNGG